MELLQKALFNLPRIQNSEGGNRPLDKLGLSHLYTNAGVSTQDSSQPPPPPQPPALPPPSSHPPSHPPGVEAVNPNIVFDVASLVLYGTHAIPVRLKILLDRLFSVLSNEEVTQILKGYGWSLDDYQRGYILKDPRGAPLERWQMCSKEEEPLVLQQFLRFGETRPITQQLLLQELSEKSNEEQRARAAQSEIKKLIERNSLAAAAAAAAAVAHHQQQQQQQQQQPPPPPPAPMRGSPSPMDRSSPTRHVSPGRRTPSVMGSPPSTIMSPKGSSPPSSSNGNLLPPSSPAATSPLNKLQSMQPFDYRNKDRKTPNPEDRNGGVAIPSSMRIPPTSMAAAAAAGLAAVGGLPGMLPNVSLSSSLANYHNSITSMTKAQQEFARSNSKMSSEQENSHSALNLVNSVGKKESYSRRHSEGKDSPTSNKMEDDNNGIGLISQEMRKKMRDNIGISYVSPTTGKKRVQCNVCLKTFCDKGALKIHFSAVHLREMHKCSVEGCNMMFSSRRSRNRHSANPNPKLHTPHLRRKISPHDGRTHQGPSIIPYHAAALASSPSTPGSGAEGRNTSKQGPPPPPPPPPGFPPPGLMPPGFNPQAFAAAAAANPGLIPPEILHRQQLELQRFHELKLNSMYGPRFGFKNGDEEAADVKRIRLSDSENDEHLDGLHKDSSEDRSSHDNASSSSIGGGIGGGNEGSSSSINHPNNNGSHNSQQQPLGGRKRKSQNPTRIKVSSDGDNDEDFSSDDDDEGFENPMDDDDDMEDTDDDEHRNNGASGSNSNSNNNDNSETGNNSEKNKDDGKSENDANNKRPETHGNTKGETSEDFGPKSSEKEDDDATDNNNTKIGSIKVISEDKLLHKEEGISEEEMEEEEIPLDRENPKRCVECSEEFDNHFLLKTHYQSVHLKLLHKCTVEGCNAGFPSKRSRDRHSSNHNLHRKLLSTDTANRFLPPNSSSSHHHHHHHHPGPSEVMARLYGDALLQQQSKLPGHAPPPPHPPPHLGGLFHGLALGGFMQQQQQQHQQHHHHHPLLGGGQFFRPPIVPPVPPTTGSSPHKGLLTETVGNFS